MIDFEKQKEKARSLRADVVKMLYLAQSGHPGGSLSVVDMLMALYYNDVMKVDPKNPKWEGRDRLVLSKGHACPALYAVLADLGFFPREDLWHLRQLHCHLQGHPDMKKTPGIDMNTGSLGQGVSVAGGMAMALNPELLFDILELRTIVEMSVLPRVAQRMDTDQLQYMGMLVESMKSKAKKGDVFAEEDRAFHMTIFKNVGNALTEQLLTALWTLLNSQIATRHPDLEAVAAQHEDILRALVRQDLDALQKSTSEQLADVRYRIMMGMLQNSGESAG